MSSRTRAGFSVTLGTVLTVLLSALLWPAPPAQAVPAKVRPPVVVLVLDEFPTSALIDKRGEISRSRFPNFARLSREASWYPNYSTTSDTTYLAVPSILSGSNARSRDTFPTFAQYDPNLFSWMHSAGYRIQADEVATRLCPTGICPSSAGFTPNPTKFASARDYMFASVKMARNGYRRDALSLVQALRIRPGELLFRQLLLPHHPYNFLPTCQEYRSGPIPLSGPVWPKGSGLPRVTVPAGNVRLGYQRLMLQVGCTDRVIGALRRAAVKQGVWKSMMLVVVGDHGVDHRPGGFRRDASRETVGSMGFTPLFIKYPGRVSGGKSSLPVRASDLFPTIAEAAGSAMPAVDGLPVSQVGTRPGQLLIDSGEYSLKDAILSRSRAIDYRNRTLGSGGLFRMGPARKFIGRADTARGLSKVDARLDTPRQYSGVNRKAGTVPAMVTGKVKRLPSGTVVAISINGRIRGTAQTFRNAGANRFGAMIDPRHLKRNNRISVFRVR